MTKASGGIYPFTSHKKGQQNYSALSGLPLHKSFPLWEHWGLVHITKGLDYLYGSYIVQPVYMKIMKIKHIPGSFSFLSGNKVTTPTATIIWSWKQIIIIKSKTNQS